MATRRHEGRKLPASQPPGSIRVQAKGQVTIERKVREDMGIRPGDEVFWIRNDAGRWELWTSEQLQDEFDRAAEGLDEFLRTSRKGYGRKLGELAGA